MKQEITENELGQVVGGAVCVSEGMKRISFTTLGEGYALKCSYQEAAALVATLFAQNTSMSEEEFDVYVKNTFINKKWI